MVDQISWALKLSSIVWADPEGSEDALESNNLVMNLLRMWAKLLYQRMIEILLRSKINKGASDQLVFLQVILK